MVSMDNMILFIFITVCIFFGVGISAILKIYSRRQQQQNQDIDDPLRSSDQQNRRNLDQEYPNRNIFVIDVGNETFYKGPPPPKYDDELPPSYEEVLRNAGLRLPPVVTSVTSTIPTATITPSIITTITRSPTITTVTTAATTTTVTTTTAVRGQSSIG